MNKYLIESKETASLIFSGPHCMHYHVYTVVYIGSIKSTVPLFFCP